MTVYVRNNIAFRITSSTAIANFKQMQASSFAQLIRPELTFSLAAREAVLIEFNRFTQFILSAERLCVAITDGVVLDNHKKAIIEVLNSEFATIDTIMAANPDIFDLRLKRFISLIHNYSTPRINEEIEIALVGQTPRAFTKIVDIISAYLQHILICMHEYNNNCIIGGKEFISLSDFSAHLNKDDAISNMKKRIDFFIQEKQTKQFIFKVYADLEENAITEIVNHFTRDGIIFIGEQRNNEARAAA